MHNDHGQFDTRSPLNRGDSGVRAKPKWPMLAAAGVGGGVVGWFIPLSLIESVTTATGLSEMIPALAPPLGSTMRALLALGGGVSALALAAMFLGGKAKHTPAEDGRSPRHAREARTVPDTVRLAPNARPAFDADYADDFQTPVQREYGENPMARHANVRQAVRDYDVNDAPIEGKESGGFFSRMKQSLSKLPLPRRFDEAVEEGGSIRDFSDLKRLRPGGEDRRDEHHDAVPVSPSRRAESPVRPIAAHAELGEPLPPLTPAPQKPTAPFGHGDYGDDLAELDRSARAAADRFAAANPAPEATPAPVLQPQAPVYQTPAPVEAAMQEPAQAPAPAPVASAPAPAQVSYDAAGIDALVARLEHALAHVRPIPAPAQTAAPELDLTAYSEAAPMVDEHAAEEARLADERRAEEARMHEEQRAEEARFAEQRRAEEARQAQITADAEAKRRADALAAQDAARKAAEEADRAAAEARRRAEEAQALLASLGVEQAAPVAQVAPAPESAPQPTPLRAVQQTPASAAEPEMDDALRSALRTLRRMSNP